MHELLIAATAIALVVVAYWYSNRAPAVSPGNTTTYTATDNALKWASDDKGAYACANTIVPNWCVLPTEAAGAAACAADASCAGYLIPGSSLTSSGSYQVLAQTYPDFVQLYSAPLVDCAACTDTTVMAKNST